MLKRILIIVILFSICTLSFKEILLFKLNQIDFISLSIDCEEEESSTENEINDEDEKKETSKWPLSDFVYLTYLNTLSKIMVKNHNVKLFTYPFSEIYSPPPKLV
jgi:hypothetical protein